MQIVENTDDLKKYDTFLQKHGYSISLTKKDVYRVERKQPLSRFLVLTIFALGILTIAVSLALAEYRLLLLSLIMILFPLINRGWKYPLAIVFDRTENFLIIESGVLFKSYKLYQMNQIDEIVAHRVEKASEVNPFTDGSEEHVYIYSMIIKDESHILMRFVTRKVIDKNAKIVSSYLNRLTK